MNGLCLFFYPIFTIAAVGFISSVLALRWLGQGDRVREIDRDARLLYYLLLVAVLSLSAFVVYIFVHVRGC